MGGGTGTVGPTGTAQPPRTGSDMPELQKGLGGVIPCANSFPKFPGLRPRSRSFSGFSTTTAKIPVLVQRRFVFSLCILMNADSCCRQRGGFEFQQATSNDH